MIATEAQTLCRSTSGTIARATSDTAVVYAVASDAATANATATAAVVC